MANPIESKRRELDPETEVAASPGPIVLLQKYESAIGVPLRKLPPSQIVILERTGTPWGWSWAPEQVAMFLQDWDSQVYMASPLLRDLALTPDPAGGGFIYERFCRPAIVEAVRKIQIMYDRPLGKLRPVPRGKFSVDLRRHPPGVRPMKFRINDWEFFGLVPNLTAEMRDQLEYMHSRWYESEIRRMDGGDDTTINLGAVNEPSKRGF